MKKLKKGRIYRNDNAISVFRGYQGGAFIFSSLNRAAKGRHINYRSTDPQYPLKNPRNWGKISEWDMKEVPFWPSLYWKLKSLLTWVR